MVKEWPQTKGSFPTDLLADNASKAVTYEIKGLLIAYCESLMIRWEIDLESGVYKTDLG